MIHEALLVLSEVILSAYPMLIKLVDVSVIFQTGLRMAVFTILAAVAAVVTKNPLAIGSLLTTETLATGILNLVHVFTSYTAFDQLTGGNAMALSVSVNQCQSVSISVSLVAVSGKQCGLACTATEG